MDRSTLPLVRLVIADIIPLQRGLKRSTVNEKRKLIVSGAPVDAPLVFKAGDVHYSGDGHHTIQAAHEEGYRHIKARIMDVGKVTLGKLHKAKKRGLVRDDAAVADPFRRQCVNAERALRKRLAKSLKQLGDGVATAVSAVWVQNPEPADVSKLSKGIPPDKDAETAKKINALLDTFEIQVAAMLEEELAAVASGAGKIMLGHIMPEGYSNLVDQVFDRAVAYSSERTGELIGKNARGTGELTETTRARIRDAITNGLEDNVGRDEIASMLADDFGFSEARANLIASTEIANANGAGSNAGLQEAAAVGLEVEHAWLCELDACEICLANQAQGFIPLDEDFDSGDRHPVAHPNCRCAEEARVVEPAVKIKPAGGFHGRAQIGSTISTPGDGSAKEATQ